MKRRVIIPLIATLLAVLTGAGSAFSQQKEDTDKGSASAAEVQALKARIDQLENQNQAIVRQNEAMMKLLNELKTKLEGPPQASNAAATSIAGRGEAIPANPAYRIPSGLTQPDATTESSQGTGPGQPIAAGSSTATAPTATGAGSATASASAGSQEEEAPLSLRIGKAFITPVGFIDFTNVFRSKNTGDGLPTDFGSVPFDNKANSHLTEDLLRSQNSQPGLRVDVDVHGAYVTGYLLMDFLGTPAPGNLITTANASTLRLREGYVNIRKDKFQVVAGQAWSLLTPNRRGLGPEHKDLFYAEKNLDPNEQLGLVWQRAPGFRFIYNASDTVAVALALENPDQYIGGSGGSGTVVLPSALATAYGTQLDNTSGSLGVPNLHPDIIAKIAFDPMIGDKLFHIEFAGVDRSFRVFDPLTSQTFTKNGGGGAVNFNFELFKNFHLLANNFYGDGGGRYLFGQSPDLIVRGDGSLSLVHSGASLEGFEAQVAKKTVLYGYYGLVYIGRNVAIDPVTGGLIGYGFAGSPSSQNRVVHEPTFGINQTIWRDAKYGALQFAVQYSYVIRHPWAFAPGTPSEANLNMVYVGLRYFLPGEAPKPGK
jgi:outer membrane murein-binding lipoprotein Lpp